MDRMVVHCKRTQYDVYIGRPQGGGFQHYGNPFTHLNYGKAVIQVSTRERAVAAYESWLLGEWWKFTEANLLKLAEIENQREWILGCLPELRGKVLGCWCAPQACHGDVLVRLANR